MTHNQCSESGGKNTVTTSSLRNSTEPCSPNTEMWSSGQPRQKMERVREGEGMLHQEKKNVIVSYSWASKQQEK